jgi:predicted enzyme related to lactoylglutathione lyase
MAKTDTHIDIGIVVRDIDACLPFYRDVVGLKFIADFKIPGGSHMWMLACGPCMVKLVTHEPTPDATNPLGGSHGGTGLRYWTMGVNDIGAAVAKCEAANAPIHVPITEIMPGTRIAMIEDPEGNVVEFLESAPR